MQTESITTGRAVDDDEARTHRRDGWHGRRRREPQWMTFTRQRRIFRLRACELAQSPRKNVILLPARCRRNGKRATGRKCRN
jgi:hypothetical protein